MNSDNQNAACCPPPRSKRWENQEIVSELRILREESLAARHRTGSPVKLPSRKVLASVVDGIGAALFPNRLGEQAIAPESVDYFVGHTLELALQ